MQRQKKKKITVLELAIQMNSSDYETTDSIIIDSNNTLKVCFDKSIYPGSALWLENSLEETLPSFVLQFAIILALNRFLFVLAEQCHVPRIVANIFVSAFRLMMMMLIYDHFEFSVLTRSRQQITKQRHNKIKIRKLCGCKIALQP